MFPISILAALVLTLTACDAEPEEKSGPPQAEGAANADDSASSGDGDDDPRSLDSGDSGSADARNDICDNPASVVPIDECVDNVLSCNRTMLHTTRAGPRRFSGEQYAAWGCGDDLSTENYSARERVYSLNHPGDGVPIEVRLTSPCGELDLIAVPWDGWAPGASADDAPTGECPTVDTEFGEDECVLRSTMGSDSLRVNAEEETRFLVIVDGRGAAGMNYQLRASCGGAPGGGGGPGDGDGAAGGGEASGSGDGSDGDAAGGGSAEGGAGADSGEGGSDEAAGESDSGEAGDSGGGGDDAEDLPSGGGET